MRKLAAALALAFGTASLAVHNSGPSPTAPDCSDSVKNIRHHFAYHAESGLCFSYVSTPTSFEYHVVSHTQVPCTEKVLKLAGAPTSAIPAPEPAK